MALAERDRLAARVKYLESNIKFLNGRVEEQATEIAELCATIERMHKFQC
jgi:prefoldin subunit 5